MKTDRKVAVTAQRVNETAEMPQQQLEHRLLKWTHSSRER